MLVSKLLRPDSCTGTVSKASCNDDWPCVMQSVRLEAAQLSMLV